MPIHDNIFAYAQKVISTWLKADPDVTATFISNKVKSTFKGVANNQLPYISVFCDGMENQDDLLMIRGSCAVLCDDVNSENMINTQQVCWEVFRSLNKEFVPGYNMKQYFVKMQADAVNLIPIDVDGNSFKAVGYVDFRVWQSNTRS